jgi:DNA-binding CsgD family transcriptional regulator/tetratricopeptide (TPR) repeat protein
MVSMYASDKASTAAAMPASIGDGVGRTRHVNGMLGPADYSGSAKLPSLYGRRRECAVLDELLDQVRGGRGTVLVLRGEAGVGKTALLEYVTARARGCRLARVTGVQSEMELAFAGLHQLCAPMLSRAESVPVPQREALRTAFGMAAGPPPDRFLVGLAVLSLLSEVAAERPLVCVIDDEQWLDDASAQALGFAARRLAADPVGLVFAARVPGKELAVLPELTVAGLAQADARVLLASALAGPIDVRVRDLIVAETGGNPLALLELPRGLSPAQLAGGFGLPGAVPLSGRIEDSFARQLDVLPEATRQLLLVAAADPSGDPALVGRAAGRLGIPAQAAGPAVEAGLLEFGAHVRFRHPLVRSAAYWSASPQDRREAHRALAEVTDPRIDPDRRAWHRAKAAAGPDEEVAAELERSAGRAQTRGGMAAAAAFLQHAVALTSEPGPRSERSLVAAQASLQAGALDAAAELVATAAAGPLDDLQQARAALLRGRIAFVSTAGSDAPALLVTAARQLEPLDGELARQTYLDAWAAALFAGQCAPDGTLHDVCRAARSAPPPAGTPGPSDLLLDGLAVLVTEGRAQAGPLLRRAARVFAEEEIAQEEGQRWGWVATCAAVVVWEEEYYHAMVVRLLQSAREAGLLVDLPMWVQSTANQAVWRGEFTEAAALIAEADAIAEATGSGFARYATVMLASFRGVEAEARPLADAVINDARAAGQGVGIQWSQWVSAILDNGLGRYESALAEAQQASEQAPELFVSVWALVELIEAASRTGQARLAAGALERLAEATSVGQTDWSQGIYARARALLLDGQDAEDSYRAAIGRLSRTRLRPELARAHLLYGEWLRREGRRVDAREQLRTAHGMFVAIGMEAFAERARRELIATGEKAPKRSAETRGQLTPQEEQIARLARDGHTSPEISAQLFLSARTVEWHLGKIFTKLGIGSRRELQAVLASPRQQDQSA